MRHTDHDKLSPWLWSGHSVPGLWRSLLPMELADWQLPRESEANCQACPMIAEAGYRPDYRCCTYYPRVANFLLGLALANQTGQDAVCAALARGMLLPEGMYAAPSDWLRSVAENDAGLYGQSQIVLCPMLDPSNGRCRIHVQRNAVCATYFCRHEDGDLGADFWGQLQTLGSQLEMALAQWALLQVGFSLQDYLARLDSLAPRIHDLAAQKGGWPEDVLCDLWAEWHGRELELYQKAAAAVCSYPGRLWDLAAAWPIVEARAYEQALDGLARDADESVAGAAPLATSEAMAYDRHETWALLQDAYRALPSR